MKCHYTPEKYVIWSQMSIEAQMGRFKIWRLRYGLGFAWVCFLQMLLHIVGKLVVNSTESDYSEKGTV